MYGQIIRNGGVFALSFATFLDTVDRTLFTPNFGTYEKLKFFNDPTSFKLIVLGIYIGLVIASLCVYYSRHVLGTLVRRLDAEGCDSPESAKALNALGLSRFKEFCIKISLSIGGTLCRVVAFAPTDSTRVGGIIAYASLNKERYRVKDDPIYLPAEKRDSAITRFRTKGSGWLSVLLTFGIGLACVVLIMKLAPYAVGAIDGILVGLGTPDNVVN